MKAKILGTENVEFKIDDKEFKGQNLYFEYDNPNVNGKKVNKTFANNGNYNVDDEIEVRFSRLYKKYYIIKK